MAGTRAGAEDRGWSFRRFETPVAGQALSDVWDVLRAETEPLLRELSQQHESLYRSHDEAAKAWEAIVTAPGGATQRRSEAREESRRAASSAAQCLVLLEQAQAEAEAQAQVETETETETETDLDPDPAVHPHRRRRRRVVRRDVVIPRDWVEPLRAELSAWSLAAEHATGRAEYAMDAAHQTRERVAAMQDRVSNFITTVWSLMSQIVKSHPPFFSAIGPIETTLYGMGRVSTDGATPVPNPDPAISTTTTSTAPLQTLNSDAGRASLSTDIQDGQRVAAAAATTPMMVTTEAQ